MFDKNLYIDIAEEIQDLMDTLGFTSEIPQDGENNKQRIAEIIQRKVEGSIPPDDRPI